MLHAIFLMLISVSPSSSSSVATAVTGLPSNITTFFQDVSCIGNENSPLECPYMDAIDPECNDFFANRSAGVRCTQGELLASVLMHTKLTHACHSANSC